MFRMTRSGMQLEADAPSWSLAREVIYQRASELGVALISHEADLVSLAPEERLGILEMKVLPALVAPNALLADAFRAMSESLPPRVGMEWRLELPEALPAIRVDPLCLHQILYNLLSNAYRFAKQGHITLGALPTTTHLHFWVADTGQGMPLEQQYIFHALLTAERPSHPVAGLGFGLHVTYQLVRLHDGKMAFSSPPGAGVTFHIYLPLPQPKRRVERSVEASPSTLPVEMDLPLQVHELTRRTITYLRQNYAAEQLSRRQIASHVAVCERHLTHVFRRDLGITPWEYLTRSRIEQAKTLLRVTNLTATEIAGRVGYNDGAYFSRVFHRETGRSPCAFRRQVRCQQDSNDLTHLAPNSAGFTSFCA